jgi:hypothetical protein
MAMRRGRRWKSAAVTAARPDEYRAACPPQMRPRAVSVRSRVGRSLREYKNGDWMVCSQPERSECAHRQQTDSSSVDAMRYVVDTEMGGITSVVHGGTSASPVIASVRSGVAMMCVVRRRSNPLTAGPQGPVADRMRRRSLETSPEEYGLSARRLVLATSCAMDASALDECAKVRRPYVCVSFRAAHGECMQTLESLQREVEDLEEQVVAGQGATLSPYVHLRLMAKQ